MEDKFRVLRNAEKYVVNGQFDRAVTEYRRIVEVHGEDPSVLNTLGDLLLKTNQREQALGCFLRVAEIFSQSGFISKAIAIYRKVEQLNPSSREAVGKLAELYTRRGLRSEALKYWRRFGDLLEQAGEKDGLVTARRQIAEMDAGNPTAHTELAGVLSSVSVDEAAQEYLAGARLFMASEAYSDAEGAARQAVTLDSSCFEAREIIAEVEERLPSEAPEGPEARGEVPMMVEAELEPSDEPVSPVPEPLELVEGETLAAVEPASVPAETPPPELPEAELEPDDLQAEADKWSAELAEEAFFDIDEGSSVTLEETEPRESIDEPPGDEDSFFTDLAESAASSPVTNVPPSSPAGPSAVRPVEPSPPSNPARAPSNLLEEVDFYLKLDLKEDAERILGGLLASHPDDPRVQARAEQLGLVARDAESELDSSSTQDTPSDEPDELSPYAADVESALDDLFFEEAEEPADPDKNATASDLAADSDEPRANFDLGMAYREMGMFEDAISKFSRGYERSMELDQPAQALNCAAMLASTCLLLDNAEESLKWADIALGLPLSDSLDYRALEYDRAAALELSGRTEESLEVYRRILAQDPEFRDVQERVFRLGQMPG